MDQLETKQPHIFFFPYMSHGHMIPTLDIAKLFSSKGIKTTLISTPHNLSLFSKAIQRSKISGFAIEFVALKFPSVEVGLPEGCEIANMVETQEDLQKFLKATTLLEPQVEKLLKQHQPNCLIADMLFPWTTDVAAKFGIPRLVFLGTNFTSSCVLQYMMKLDFSGISDSESLVIPNLPHEFKLAGNQIPDFMKIDSEMKVFAKSMTESVWKSHGVIINSFYEVEPAYADHYRNILGIKAWHIGPAFLCNKEIEDKAHRGLEASLDEHKCLNWLNCKKPSSVIYVSFGSVVKFDDAQLLEIALGLEASGQQFIWVVKKENGQENEGKWLPLGFEKRVESRGFVVKGWAPQVPILEHQATGGFMTHCGWNSTMEAVTAGVPMATWPAFADQFYNEKLVTDILGIGVRVGDGARKWSRFGGNRVGKDDIEKAVTEIMVGEAAKEMRSKVKRLGEMARKSVEEGGSSYKDFNTLIQELGLH